MYMSAPCVNLFTVAKHSLVSYFAWLYSFVFHILLYKHCVSLLNIFYTESNTLNQYSCLFYVPLASR